MWTGAAAKVRGQSGGFRTRYEAAQHKSAQSLIPEGASAATHDALSGDWRYFSGSAGLPPSQVLWMMWINILASLLD